MYTVKESERVWTIVGRANLPDDVFKQWRKRQSAECMRKKRALERQDKQQISGAPNVDRELQRPPLSDVRSSQEAGTSKEQPENPLKNSEEERAKERAVSMITCKVCQDAEVKRIIIPCGHVVFCASCLTRAMSVKAKCPICRSVIVDHFGVIMIE